MCLKHEFPHFTTSHVLECLTVSLQILKLSFGATFTFKLIVAFRETKIEYSYEHGLTTTTNSEVPNQRKLLKVSAGAGTVLFSMAY